MRRFALWRVCAIGGLLGYAVLVLLLTALDGVLAPQSAQGQSLAVFNRPTHSSPIALSANNALVWSVNPDDDSVSVISTSDNRLLTTIRVGDEPQSIALDPDNNRVYVANAASNTVTVIRITNPSPTISFRAAVDTTVNAGTTPGHITTGAEPWNIVISPDGLRVFVANSGQDTVTVIDSGSGTPTVLGNIDLRNSACNGTTAAERQRHFQPRGLAVTVPTGGGAAQLYVTRFFSFVRAGGTQGSDTGKEGVVCRINIDTDAGIGSYVALPPIRLAPQVTGFRLPGTTDDTSAYPNQLQSIVIRGTQAYLPNIAASPTRPLRFNVDTHAFVNRINNIGTTDQDAGAINLHLGASPSGPNKPKLFFANPWAIGFTNQTGSGSAYVVSAGSDVLVKLNVDPAGALSFTDGARATKVIDLNDPDNVATSGKSAGKNPLGIAITDNGATAYVMNYVSRNVSVVNLTTDSVVKVIETGALPPPGTLDEVIQVGKEIFFSSRGLFDRPNGTTVSTRNRLSSEGWQNCASCHFGGMSDANIWQFGTGPRKSVPLNATWNPQDPNDQRILNYSAIFDEVQDFEANIRNVSGPGNLSNGPPAVLDPNHGLIFGATINDAPAAVPPLLNLANAGRPQHTVTLPGVGREPVPALDAMSEWVRFGVRTPNSPLTTAELTAGGGNTTGGTNATTIAAGRTLFFQAGCQTCHGGGKWTNSTKDFVSPALASEVSTEVDSNGATAPNPNAGQYLNRFLRNINSFNLHVNGQGNNPGGQPLIGAPEVDTAGRDGLGKDHDGDGKGAGFNTPALLGIFSAPPYYHNGACETLSCVLANTTHRRAGLRAGQADPLNDAGARNQVLAFLESIDAQTAPATNLRIFRHDIFLDPPTLFTGETVTVGANVSLFGPKVLSFSPGPLKVTFLDGDTVIGTADLAGVDTDFGQETVSVQWTVPNRPGLHRITVRVDATNLFVEDNERDNTASRRVLVRQTPPDRTPPTVSDAQLNGGAAIATSTAATVTFRASDPTSPSPRPTTGVSSFCVVRYSYSQPERRWVEESCQGFSPLPAANANGSFTVPVTLRPRAGTAYVFVWVKDGAGNISRTPAFDVIGFVPAGDIEIDRNDVRVFRITLPAGQSVSMSFPVKAGDVDVSVFQGILANATRIQVSALNGLATETVSFTAPASPATTTFQVEVRAVVNSVFAITVSQSAGASLEAGPPAAGKEVPTAPIVAGPPALRAAVDEPFSVYTPLLRR